MAPDPERPSQTGLIDDALITEEDIRRETQTREWMDGARYIHWVGMALVGSFLGSWIGALPARFADPTWQLNLIALVLGSGGVALLGALLICIARLFNLNDRQIQNRALLVRTLSSWVALGWLLLIPLQLFISVRLLNSQARQEVAQIQNFESISREVRNSTSEEQLRAAFGRIPNQPPLPRITVPLEVAKANLLSALQKNINSARNNQETASSNRWQAWMKEALRNTVQTLMFVVGFLALGKNRILDPRGPASSSKASRSSRSRSRSD